jgi:hypothetical protein
MCRGLHDMDIGLSLPRINCKILTRDKTFVDIISSATSNVR